jgi:hypothetical protein
MSFWWEGCGWSRGRNTAKNSRKALTSDLPPINRHGAAERKRPSPSLCRKIAFGFWKKNRRWCDAISHAASQRRSRWSMVGWSTGTRMVEVDVAIARCGPRDFARWSLAVEMIGATGARCPREFRSPVVRFCKPRAATRSITGRDVHGARGVLAWVRGGLSDRDRGPMPRAHQSAPMARLPILDTHGLADEICPDLSRPCCHSMMSMMVIVRTVRVRHALNRRG